MLWYQRSKSCWLSSVLVLSFSNIKRTQRECGCVGAAPTSQHSICTTPMGKPSPLWKRHGGDATNQTAMKNCSTITLSLAISLTMILTVVHLLSLGRNISSPEASACRKESEPSSTDDETESIASKNFSNGFCRAVDGASLVLLSPLRRLRVVEIPERKEVYCASHAAKDVRETRHGVSVLSGCTQESCGSLEGCFLSVHPSQWQCSSPAVLIALRAAKHLPTNLLRIFTSHVDDVEQHNDMVQNPIGIAGISSHAIARCTELAMSYSFCVHHIQILRTGSDSVECHLFQQFLVDPVDEHSAVPPNASLPLFTFVHRTEWRPSLLRDTLRLVTVKPLDQVTIVNSDSTRTVRLPSVSVAIRWKAGVLVPLGVTADVTLNISVESIADASVRTLAIRYTTWSSPLQGSWQPLLDGAMSEIAFQNLPRLAVNRFIGGKLVYHISAVVRTLSGSQSAIVRIAKRFESKLLLKGQQMSLRFATYDKQSSAAQAPSAMLREGEWYLNGVVVARGVAAGGLKETESIDNAVALPDWNRDVIYTLELSPGTDRCVDLVDGHRSVATSPQEIRFASLIFSTSRCNESVSSMALVLREGDRGDKIATANTLVISLVGHHRHGAVVEPRASGAVVAQSLPILISINVHKNLTALRLQLANIAAFAPSSIVVLHIARQWRLSAADMEIITKMNGTVHPLVLVNSVRSMEGFARLVQVQLRNVMYVAQAYPWLRWSHAVLMASNEWLVKAGIEDYVQRFDLSSWKRPDADSSSAFTMLHCVVTPQSLWSSKFVDPDDEPSAFDFWSSRVGEGGLKGEHGLANMMRQLNLHKLPRSQIYTEGSFFSRDIALWLSWIMDTMLPMDEVHHAGNTCRDLGYSVSEVTLYTILQDSCTRRKAHNVPIMPFDVTGAHNVTQARQFLQTLHASRCAEHSGMMVWGNNDWEVSPSDITRVRCSVYSPPFSLKRMREPAMEAVLSIQKDVHRVALLRDNTNHCSAAIESSPHAD